jgi:hypothetical protein
LTNNPWNVAARVYHGIPATPCQALQIGGAISEDMLSICKEIWVVLATMEERYTVPGFDRTVDKMAP